MGHGIYMPFPKIIKDPLFSPDTAPIDVMSLGTTRGSTPGLHRSASDSATSTTRRESSDKPLSEKIFDKFLELTATDSSDSVDGMFY